MFDLQKNDQAQGADKGKQGREDSALHGEDKSEQNSVWQTLAMRPVGIRPMLNVSRPDDPHEREAERIADGVLRAPEQQACPCGGSCSSCRAERRGGEQLPSQAGPARAASEDETVAPLLEDEVSQSPGRPLDSTTGALFEKRFGHDFSRVRVHDDSRAAATASALRASAYTLGSDIVFGAGAYAPATQQGRSLLAHELAHVVQQSASASSQRATLARQTWGTAKTTAPPAKNESPGDVFRARLKDEVALFANAGVILDWIVAQRASGASVTAFKASALFADAATMKKMKPVPASAGELVPALEMLEYYKVVPRAGPGDWHIVLPPLATGQTQQDVNRAGFDKNRKDIAAFQQSFETRFDAKGHPVKQIAQQELLEDTMAAGAASEFKAQKDAETNLAAVTAELGEFVAFRKKGPPVFRVTTDSPSKVTVKDKTNVLLPVAGQKKPTPVDEADFDRIEPVKTGTSPEVEARRKDIEARLKKAERTLFNAEGFHRFATEMVWFLHELANTSAIKFKAGTYPRHGKFGEYAADMYPSIIEDSRGFYKVDKAEQFVDDINKVAEAGNPYWGKFAWQIVYNDATLQTKINAKYGARMSSAPHHGPSPDKLHMHLDIRPLNVVADPDTGFGVNPSGRVVLY